MCNGTAGSAKHSRMAADPVAKPCKPCCEIFFERELESFDPSQVISRVSMWFIDISQIHHVNVKCLFNICQ